MRKLEFEDDILFQVKLSDRSRLIISTDKNENYYMHTQSEDEVEVEFISRNLKDFISTLKTEYKAFDKNYKFREYWKSCYSFAKNLYEQELSYKNPRDYPNLTERLLNKGLNKDYHAYFSQSMISISNNISHLHYDFKYKTLRYSLPNELDKTNFEELYKAAEGLKYMEKYFNENKDKMLKIVLDHYQKIPTFYENLKYLVPKFSDMELEKVGSTYTLYDNRITNNMLAKVNNTQMLRNILSRHNVDSFTIELFAEEFKTSLAKRVSQTYLYGGNIPLDTPIFEGSKEVLGDFNREENSKSFYLWEGKLEEYIKNNFNLYMELDKNHKRL